MGQENDVSPFMEKLGIRFTHLWDISNEHVRQGKSDWPERVPGESARTASLSQMSLGQVPLR